MSHAFQMVGIDRTVERQHVEVQVEGRRSRRPERREVSDTNVAAWWSVGATAHDRRRGCGPVPADRLADLRGELREAETLLEPLYNPPEGEPNPSSKENGS